MKNFILALSLLSIVLTNCASPTPTVTSATPTVTTESFESPLSTPVVQAESPVATPPPDPTPTPPEVLQIPTQDLQMASIEGSITMQGHPPGTFPATLYLGDPTGANPMGAYVSLDIETAARGYVKPDGTFIFPNVPPGTYAIVAWTPTGAYITPDPATGSTWLIEISGNSHFDAKHILVPAFSVED